MRRSFQLSFIVVAVLGMGQLAAPHWLPGQQHVRVVDFDAPPADWPQFNFDVRHSGANANELLITRANVASLQLIFQRRLPGIADGAPVLWANNSNRRSDHYLFFTATNGTLMATNGEGELLWQGIAPAGPRWTTSSPVLDPSRQYVYSYALDGRIHKYAVATGLESFADGWPVLVTRKPEFEKQSAALSIVTTTGGTSYLYATLAGYPDPGDAGDYQGHIVAIRLDNAHTRVFNSLCSDKSTLLGYGECADVRAGIWGRSGVVYSESMNSIFVVTSNGTFDAAEGGKNWGDSILRLRPDLRTRGGVPLDSYTPEEFQTLDERDLDLGSSAIALVARPGERVPTLAVQAGKDSTVRLIDLKNMSGHGGPGHVGGELQKIKLPQNGFHFASPAVWVDPDTNHTWVYFANHRGISAFEITGHHDDPQLVPRWRSNQAANSSPVVANGVVFTVRNERITAFDAETGDELWADTRIRDIHWQSPIVVNGAVYITDLSGNVTCYALPKAFTFVN